MARFLPLVLAFLLLLGCQPRPTEATRASGPRTGEAGANAAGRRNAGEQGEPTPSSPASPSQPSQRPAVAEPGRRTGVQWTPLYVSASPGDRNVFLESVKSDAEAAALILADRVACLGELLGPGSGFGMIPKQAVAWEDRDPAIPRRVVVEGYIACRQGYLEHFLSRMEAGKDHESIVSGSFDAQSIHVGLLALGLKPGHPAQFWSEKEVNGERVAVEDFKPPTGDAVRVDVEYAMDGKWRRSPAQAWVLNAKTKKPLAADWVFAGSLLADWEAEPGKKEKFYGANTGRVICVTNWTVALLDVPFRSNPGDPTGDSLDFVANTDALPPRLAPVRVILEPKTR